jgi:phosphatidate cytidylyltransferase
MLKRIISALVAIPIVLALLFYRDGGPFTILVGIAALLGLLEFYRATAKGDARPHAVLGIIAGILIFFLATMVPFGMWQVIPVFTTLILTTLAFELRRQQPKPLLNAGVTILGVGYVVWLLLHFVWMRDEATRVITVGPWESELGAWLVMLVFLTTWAVDSGAYFIGRFLGKTKLAPRLSPGKTIEGSVGGFVSAVVIGAVVGAIIRLPQPHGLILGALVGIVAQIGDLTESAWKREVGIKDSGALIPGHGGILDRIDSLLFTGPLVYWYLSTFLWKCISP